MAVHTPAESKDGSNFVTLPGLGDTYHVAIVGNEGVGKTSLIARMRRPAGEMAAHELEALNTAAAKTGVQIAPRILMHECSYTASKFRGATRWLSGVHGVEIVISGADRAGNSVHLNMVLNVIQSMLNGAAWSGPAMNRVIVVFSRARQLAVPKVAPGAASPYRVRWAQSCRDHEKTFRKNLATCIAEKATPAVAPFMATLLVNSLKVVFVENSDGMEGPAGFTSWTDTSGWNILPDGARCHQVLFDAICQQLLQCSSLVTPKAPASLKDEVDKASSEAAAATWQIVTLRQQLQVALDTPAPIVYQ